MELYHKQNVKARKPHKCEFCKKVIAAGKTYSYESGKYEGDFFQRKLCLTCSKMLDLFCRYTEYDEFSWDWIQEWLSNNYCKAECKDTCKYGFLKIQCCPIVREAFNKAN